MSCFHGGQEQLAPIAEDNLFEAIDAIQQRPEIPVTLIAGVCMICPPCGKYDPVNKLCVGGRSMALRDQKKDLDVLQKLGLKYGDTLPAPASGSALRTDPRPPATSAATATAKPARPNGASATARVRDEPYQKARAARLGIKG